MEKTRHILVTGSGGFIGKNMVVRLREQADTVVLQFGRGDTSDMLAALVLQADAIVHLAGENRPEDIADFKLANVDLTQSLCDAIRLTGRKIPLILSSSTQAELNNPYGQSKRDAEQIVGKLARETDNPVVIYRLPGVFGKWCRPDYNSVVATFCHNIANDLPIRVNDATADLHLAYIDDVLDGFMQALADMAEGLKWGSVEPVYSISLGDLASQIRAFRNCRDNLILERVGTGLTRALYATYISYLPPSRFIYDLPCHADTRGIFAEFLKTPDCGQFSFFTANPGITRGEHYHHSKTEKFLVVRGEARFRFRHMVSNEACEIFVSGDKSRVVETIPGWAHDITNVGDSEMIVMIWANEIFDRHHPDTIACKV